MRKFLLLVFLSIPMALAGQGFQVNLQGQKQNSMSGAGSALILDESAVFFNPGGMSMIGFNAVSMGVSPLRFNAAFNGVTSDRTERVSNRLATPIMAYALWGPESAQWKLGLGVYTPFGGLVDWGNKWTGKYSLSSLDLKTLFIQPTFSYRLTERLGIGAGFVYTKGTVDFQQVLPLSFSDGSEGHAQLKGSGNGFGWNAGLHYIIPNLMAISVVHHSKVTTSLTNGEALFTVPSSLRENFPAGNTFDAELPLPSSTTLGLAFPINEQISIAVDASFVNWSVYEELAFDYAENTSTLADTRLERNYGNGGSITVGIQHQTTEKLTLRAGTGYVLTPVKDGFVTPEAPDANRFKLSAGFSYFLSANWELNASFLYENIESRTQTNMDSGLTGTFKTFVYSPGISIGYRW